MVKGLRHVGAFFLRVIKVDVGAVKVIRTLARGEPDQL